MRKRQGYTIIEVTLVAMIAALIFLMVFLALPSMWANERDSERRTDVAYFINRLKNYQTNNNRGALPKTSTTGIATSCGSECTQIPYSSITEDFFGNTIYANDSTSWVGFYSQFFTADYMDPSGDWYGLNIQPCEDTVFGHIGLGDNCNTTNEANLIDEPQDYTLYVKTGATCNGSQAVKSANTRNVAVLYRLERGAVYCENT